MGIKVIIATNNDILFNSLSNFAFEYEGKIEIINVPSDNLSSLTYHINSKENLIVLDPLNSVSFYISILKHAIDTEENIVIVVIDSKHITNIINHEKNRRRLFWKKKNNFSFFDAFNLFADAIKDTLEIENKIDNVFWKIGLTSYFKGTIYIKDAILLTYNDKNLLLDMNSLMIKIAEKNNVKNYKIVRSAMDKSLNTMLNNTDISVFYDVFEDYDGRKISLKYFIDLCIRFLEKQNYCCLEN